MTRLVILALAYFGTGWLGLKIPYAGSHITLVWLPTGIAVAALLRWSWRVWPGITLGAFLVNLAIGSTWALAAAIAVGNTLGPLLTATWLRRSGFHINFDRKWDVAAFVGASGAGMMLSASLGVANLHGAQLLPLESIPSAWLSWWMGDTVGALLAAPLLLTIDRENIEKLLGNRREILFWTLVAGPVAWLAFVQDYEQIGRSLPLAFMTLPLFAWAALRFGNTGAALAGLGFSVLAAWSTATGHGTFFLPDARVSLFLLWSYMATTVLTGLLITALQAERLAVENILRESEHKYRLLFETAGDGIFLQDENGFIDCNEKAASLCGLSRTELMGRSPADIAPDRQPDGRLSAAVAGEMFAAALRGIPQRFEWQSLRGDGVVFDVEVTLNRLEYRGAPCVLAVARDISQRKMAEKQLHRELNFRQELIESLPGVFYVFDTAGRFQSWNHNLETVTGRSTAEIEQSHPLDLFDADDKSRVAEAIRTVFASGRATVEARFLTKDGRYVPHFFYGTCVTLEGQPTVVGLGIDITDRMRVEQALAESESRFREIFNTVNDAIFVHDAETGRIVDVNQRMCEMYGLNHDEALACGVNDLSAGVPPYTATEAREKIRRACQDGPQTFEWHARAQDGRLFWVEVSLRLARIGSETRILAAVRDISERKASEAQVEHLAHHDALTDLPNRDSLHEVLAQALGLAKRSETQIALLLIDLDHFKVINDTLGHQTGDKLLVTMAQRLGASIRQSDFVARLGGDEFVVVLSSIDSLSRVAHVAEKIAKAVAEPCRINGHELRTSASIGICIYPDDATDGPDLIQKAEVAMYHAKAHGRANYQFFAPAMQAAAVKRLAIEADLHVALEQQQFLLYYQPQLDLRTGKLSGVEALLRWLHPERGLVPPLDFIPVAEETGLIVPIGDWVLQEACRQMAAWRAAGILHIRMSVNLAASQFADPILPLRIQEIMDTAGVPSGSLDLEVTESMTMSSPADTIAMMKVLTGQGLSLSIDDFGTGYSSLAYLKLFPISTLKIDHSFVKDIETDPNDADICDVTVLLAHKLGMNVVAEGVETEGQLKFLLSIGCEKIQGYLISKPLPADQAEAFIRYTPAIAEFGTIDLWAGAGKDVSPGCDQENVPPASR